MCSMCDSPHSLSLSTIFFLSAMAMYCIYYVYILWMLTHFRRRIKTQNKNQTESDSSHTLKISQSKSVFFLIRKGKWFSPLIDHLFSHFISISLLSLTWLFHLLPHLTFKINKPNQTKPKYYQANNSKSKFENQFHIHHLPINK